MPLINVPIQQGGAIANALVGVSQARAQALIAAGQTVPAPVTGTFLIDTGATSTCVDAALIAGLGLPLIGRVMMQTPSTAGVPVACDQFDASFYIPGAAPDAMLVIPALPLMAVTLAPQGIHGLIGRDILDRCMVTYHGPARFVTIAH